MKTSLEMILSLINSVAVIMVIAYVVTRSKVYSEILEKKFSAQNVAFMIIIFGLFSIYGTLSGVNILGAISNIRDLGPLIAGLVGGPVVGIGAALIGAGHRLTQGGFTQTACSLATLVAGITGGLVYKLKKGEFVGVKGAVLLAVLVELVHMGLALIFSKPFDQALAVVKKVIMPMILANGAGMWVFAFFISNLLRERATEAAKRLIEGELMVAREIQMSIVPRIFPPFPNRSDLELYAILEPAKEVGGDFYDFFFIDDDRLFFVIGDVSGKGVPASLFMAVTRTLLRSKTSHESKPDEILAMANDILCQDNDSAMFVTVFCGILDTRTGRVEYCNGGHNPPFVARANGQVERVEGANGIALGIMEDMFYSTRELILNSGDCLVMYTDGVTEAMNTVEELYGEDRLVEVLHASCGETAAGIIEISRTSINAFTTGAAQSDDITMLTVRYLNNR
ncbi:MAG: PP2C family protein-serine/threonine phosphatase [Chitinophagales bacterium]